MADNNKYILVFANTDPKNDPYWQLGITESTDFEDYRKNECLVYFFSGSTEELNKRAYVFDVLDLNVFAKCVGFGGFYYDANSSKTHHVTFDTETLHKKALKIYSSIKNILDLRKIVNNEAFEVMIGNQKIVTINFGYGLNFTYKNATK